MTDSSDMDDHRTRLGTALLARADDVADIVLATAWPEGCDPVEDSVLDAVAETDRAGARLIGRWLVGGAHMTEDERRSVGALGGMIDRVGLDELLKAYLGWRDAMLGVLAEEAARLDTPDELVAEVVDVVTRNSDGSLVRMARQFEDERARLHQRLAEQALHDDLTGLPNRVLLFERMEQALRASTRTGHPMALLFIDLDGFKAVNDRFGHQAGDELLIAVTRRICDTVRSADTVARLGGDEFVVLCESVTDPHHPVEVAERVISALTDPFALGTDEVEISASVGIAAAAGADSASDVLMRADIAMYAAKQQGPGRHELSPALLV